MENDIDLQISAMENDINLQISALRFKSPWYIDNVCEKISFLTSAKKILKQHFIYLYTSDILI